MIFNLLDFQISTEHRIFYIDVASAETEDSDQASGLYSLFHLAWVDGEWFWDILYLKNTLMNRLRKFFE